MSKNRGYRQNHKPIDEAMISEDVKNDAADEQELEKTPEMPTSEPDETAPEQEQKDVEKSVTGVVDGCNVLNIRKAPSKDADVVCKIGRAAAVVIDTEKSTDGFYKVYTESGAEGFCMKEYIRVDQV